MDPPRRHGPWQIVARREVYRDPWIELTCDDVIRPDGAPGTHSIVRLKSGVSVLALDENDTVYLTEEFHYAVGRTLLEVVSGGIEAGEAPSAAARRELEEELGISAGELVDLGACDPLSSVIVAPVQLFLARRLSFGAASPEGTEHICCRRVPLAEAVQMVLDSRITHAPTCVLILKVTHLLGR
jgi:ADP-ribose pyrophosphatase